MVQFWQMVAKQVGRHLVESGVPSAMASGRKRASKSDVETHEDVDSDVWAFW